MRSPALIVLDGVGPNRIARATSTPRIRPGERPVAVDLELVPAEVKAVRADARDAGISVDGYVSVLLEYRSLCELAGHARVSALADTVRVRPYVDAVAASELQSWHRLLTGRVAPPGDDLPTVFVPLRLATALPQGQRAAAVKRTLLTDALEIRRAITLETVATVRGVVMQTWALAQFAAASGGSAAAL